MFYARQISQYSTRINIWTDKYKHKTRAGKNPSRLDKKLRANIIPMAAISSSAVTASLTTNPLRKSTSIPSSSSFSFRNSINRVGFGLSVDRPRRDKKRVFSCNCLFGLGVPELVVIAGVAALVFGPKQLPEVGRSFGKTIKSFQQAAKEFESELKKEPEEKSAEDTDNKITAVSEEEKPQEAKV